jgi:dTMP kinase
MARGNFITFEGGEGAGKSTQVARLAAALRGAGHQVLTTREPGGSPGAESIRQLLVTGDAARWDPWCEVLLHVVARRDHLTSSVLPALAAGQWVLCDRFADSTMAYQGYGQGLGRAAVQDAHDLALGDLEGWAPDLTLILDVPVELGLERAAARRDGEDRYESMALAFHQRLRDGYLEIAAKDSARCRLIDAHDDLDAVETAVWTAITECFGAPPR